MSEFNFNSQVCTDRFQSERLLALGLKKETADCCYYYYDGEYLIAFAEDAKYESDIPAWSLHRLIEMMPRFVEWEGGAWLYMSHDDVLYTDLNYVTKDFSCISEIYNNVISAIEWLIKEGYFNKDYLQEQAGSSREG